MEFWEFIKNYFIQLMGLDKLGTPQGNLNFICTILTFILGVFVAYKAVFTVIGFVSKKITYPEAPMTKKYCFIICARNEEDVISNPIDSIKKQDYPTELIDIIVLADNCSPTDKTAQIAREKGCIVYERHDPSKQRKGWGLEFLFDHIKKDIGLHTYDAYIFLDADNAIATDFVRKMNNAYSTGKFDVITGYRNSKNFSDNAISAAYGFNFYRFILSCHRPRMVVGSGTSGTGTGYLASADLFEDGWHYHQLLEDSEFVLKLTSKGKRFGFSDEAVCYDEQPTNFWVSCRQRLRWSKGALELYFKSSWGLLASFFKKPNWTKYDMYWEAFPYQLVVFLLGFIYQLVSLILFLIGLSGGYAYDWNSFLIYFFTQIGGILIGSWFVSILVTIKEWKYIHCTIPQAILYNFLWPWYDLISIPLSIICIFMKVKWKHIPHKDQRNIDDLNKETAAIGKEK